jgi:hypothetical protein
MPARSIIIALNVIELQLKKIIAPIAHCVLLAIEASHVVRARPRRHALMVLRC